MTSGQKKEAVYALARGSSAVISRPETRGWPVFLLQVIRSNRWVCEGRGYLHKQGQHHG